MASFSSCSSFSKYIPCSYAKTHRHSEHTHKVVLETRMHTQMAFLQTQYSVLWIDQCCSPATRLTDTLVYFSHAHLKSNIFLPTEKACVFLARRTKKVGKYQQVLIYIRTKTNKPRRKELLRRSKASLHQKSFSCGLRQPASQI